MCYCLSTEHKHTLLMRISLSLSVVLSPSTQSDTIVDILLSLHPSPPSRRLFLSSYSASVQSISTPSVRSIFRFSHSLACSPSVSINQYQLFISFLSPSFSLHLEGKGGTSGCWWWICGLCVFVLHAVKHVRQKSCQCAFHLLLNTQTYVCADTLFQ